MERAAVAGVELEYESRGNGVPVVLIHNGAGPDWLVPLSERIEASGFRTLRYYRVGYRGSSPLSGAIDFGSEAAHCAALLAELGIARAHIVGHSSSGMIALQLALDHPEVVHTLGLLESARPAPQTPLQAEFVTSYAIPALQSFQAGDRKGAVDIWLRGTCGPEYASVLEREAPGAFEQAVADSETFFGAELPAVQQWSFAEDDARRVAQPALCILGEHSDPAFGERRELLLSWLPNAEPFDLPGAGHLLHIQNLEGAVAALLEFFSRHSLDTAG